MKNALFIISYCLLAIYMLASCEDNTDIETPPFNPKLVIYSFICPSDTILLVHVGTTTNNYGKLQDYPNNLPVKVKLLDNEQVVEFSTIDTLGFCKAKHTIEPGHEYKIVANCEGYPEALAVCRVPELKNDFSLSIDTVSKFMHSDWGENYEFVVNVKFKDIPDQTNYYNLFANVTTVYKDPGDMKYIYQLYPRNNDNGIASINNILFSDHLQDGKILQGDFTGYSFSYSNIYNFKTLEFAADLLEVDEDYYKYHKSLETYSGTDDPFTEYSPVYTNVTGGYGIFASYVKYEKILKVK